MVRIAWTTKAIEDVFQIQQYYASVPENYVQAFVSQIFKKVEIIKSYPNLGVEWFLNLTKRKLRELLYRKYRIIYRILASERIDILAIHHGAKALSKQAIFP